MSTRRLVASLAPLASLASLTWLSLAACSVSTAPTGSDSTGDETAAGDSGNDEADATEDSGAEGADAGETGSAPPSTEACFETPEYAVFPDGIWTPYFVDVDLDGRLDIVGTDGDFEGLRFVTLIGRDDAPWFDHVATVDAAGGGPGGRSGGPSFGDLEGDGVVDMLFANVVYIGDGAGGFTYAGIPSLPFGFSGLAAFVDLDDDGISDGIAANFEDPATPIGTFFGQGNGNFDPGPTVALPSPAYGIGQVMHVGSPGGPDDLLVLVDDEQCGGWGGGGGGGCTTVRRRPVVLDNLGGGMFDATEGETIDGSPITRARVDFSGDGAPDLIGSSGTGGVITWIRHSPGYPDEHRIGELPLNEAGALEVDDEDGIDIVGLGDDPGSPALVVYSGVAPDSVLDPWEEPLDFAPSYLRTIDLEGDGADEILLFGMRNGEWTMAVLRPRSC